MAAKRLLTVTEEKLLQIQEKLDSWNSFVKEVQVPAELYVALSSCRPELISLAKPRDLKAEEVAVLYRMIGILIETNQALQQHASLISDLAEQTTGHLKGLISSLDKLESFADFKSPIIED